MAYILFSGVGKSDPVRGFHDGGMLHIVRHYKPTDVYLFLTAEIKELDEKDDRLCKGIKSVEQILGYCPHIHKFESGIVDADDFDAFLMPFKKILDEIVRAHPGDRILFNLSSGTTQMKTTMCLLATDPRYSPLGIQVRNWEPQSNNSDNTASANYELDVELELNEDNNSDAVNRCVEPETIVLRRDGTKKQLYSLIKQYNYKAAVQLAKDSFVADKVLGGLLAHAEARHELREREAREAIKELQIDKARLYPIKLTAQSRKCYELMEYFLILQNYQRTERYTEMVIRMNPFIIALQEEYLNLIPDFSVEGICEKTKDKRYNLEKIGIKRDKLKKVNEKLLEYLDFEMGSVRDNSDPSIVLYNRILQYFEENTCLGRLSKKDILFFNVCEVVNQRFRNNVAHKLQCVYECDIIRATEVVTKPGMDCKTIIERFRDLLRKLYGNDKCPNESFEVYDTINEEIQKRAEEIG